MGLGYQSMSVRLSADCTEPTISWWVTRNLRWVRTSSRPAATIGVTESTLAVARSFTTRGFRTACAGDRWKRFLSLVSQVASGSG